METKEMTDKIELPVLPEPWADPLAGWAFTTHQMRDYALAAIAANASLHIANLQAGEPVGELIASDMAIALHYPEHWDTAAYPTVMDALAEVIAHFQCSSEDHQASPSQQAGKDAQDEAQQSKGESE